MTDAPDDPHLWLEDVTGDDALAWVRERNAEAQHVLESAEFRGLEKRLRGVLDSDAKIPYVNKIGAHAYDGPGLAVQWVEVEGPIHDAWPPASHRRIFGDLPQAPVARDRLEVVSKNPMEDASRILRGFAKLRFREGKLFAEERG